MLRSRPFALALAALLALAPLLAPALAAPGDAPPPAAARSQLGNVTAYAWTGLADGTPRTAWSASESGTLFLVLDGTNATAGFVNGTLSVSPTAAASLDLASFSMPLAAGARVDRPFAFTLADLEGDVTFTLALFVSGNGTSANATLTVPVTVTRAPVAPPSGLSPLAIGALAAVVLVGGGAWLYARSKRQVKVAPRSRALREEAIERGRRPEEAAVVAEEVRREEAVRVERREVQILQAKRADAQRTIERLDERRAAGQLTELQHARMTEKKRAELADIERQIREFDSAP